MSNKILGKQSKAILEYSAAFLFYKRKKSLALIQQIVNYPIKCPAIYWLWCDFSSMNLHTGKY